METWFIILISLCISALIKALLSLFNSDQSKTQPTLPPGPTTIPVIGNFLWLRKSFAEIEPALRSLVAKYGPVVTLRIGHRPAIFVATHSLAHQALIENGAVFADRPSGLPTTKIMSSNQHNISSASYGATWRLLRRNLTSEILHPSRVKMYSRARDWVLHDILINRLKSEAGDNAVRLIDHFQYAMFCLLVLMCFGDKLEENKIKEIETVQRRMLLAFGRFNVINFLPRLSKVLFRSRWRELLALRKSQEVVLVPLIRSRVKLKQIIKEGKQEENDAVSYVDTLLELRLSNEQNRNLTEDEIVSLCSEFLNAGTDTTSTALQWIMANLVKHPHIQNKLYEEMREVVPVGPPAEEDLDKLPYLKAVVLEGLRRHPPGHFVLPHAVTEEVVLGGYVVPKNATVNFMVADMGWDPKVWKDPMEFKPERFLGPDSGVDITGTREIKMMPFGAGRRVCPGSGLAMLHLEYFVANLVWHFEWRAVDGDDVDLSEKQEFTMVMKNPLRAQISPR